MGSNDKSVAGNSGWKGLAPQPDNDGRRWSAFIGKVVDRQSLVEAVGTLVFEATLRILPYRGGTKKDAPETVLGHAAAAHGTALDILERLDELEAKIDSFTNNQKDDLK